MIQKIMNLFFTCAYSWCARILRDARLRKATPSSSGRAPRVGYLNASLSFGLKGLKKAFHKLCCYEEIQNGARPEEPAVALAKAGRLEGYERERVVYPEPSRRERLIRYSAPTSLFFLILFICATTSLMAFAPTNFFRPYDAAIRLPLVTDADFRFGARLEYGDASTGRNFDDFRRNILALHDDSESALKMLASPVGAVATNAQLLALKARFLALGFLGDPLDNGIRGHEKFSGRFKELDTTLWGSYYLPFEQIPGTLAVSLHLPVVFKRVDGVTFVDQTSTTSRGTALNADNATRLLTGPGLLQPFVQSVGNLDLSNWNQTGLGDMVLMFDWWREYRQEKEFLRWVTLLAKVGISFPTGKEKNEDKAFSMPLGNDGAWGLPIGIGMELDFVHNIKAGLDVDFLVLFDKKRIRRLKTDPEQTEILLLNKGVATKEHGLTWQFHLFLQAYHFVEGLSAKMAYQFVKHDDDTLDPQGNDFDFSIVNSGTSVKEWTLHNLIFSLNYDLFTQRDCYKDEYTSGVVPQFQLFYKVAVGGRNVIDANTIGGQLGIHF